MVVTINSSGIIVKIIITKKLEAKIRTRKSLHYTELYKMSQEKSKVNLATLSKAVSKFLTTRKRKTEKIETIYETFKTSRKTPECKLKRRLSKRFSTQKKVAYKCDTMISVLGASKTGKTKLVQSIADLPMICNARKLSYRPTLTEKYSKSISLKSKNGIVCKHQIQFVDTSGKFRSCFRPMFIDTVKSSEAFIVMFSIESQSSLKEAEKIIEEIDQLKRNNNTPILLIAMKNAHTSVKQMDHETLTRISKINRGLYFLKTMSETENFMDSIVCLLTEIERRNGINRGCDEVIVL